jgi:tetratricopeptide (TPR) repeat protein
MTTRLRVLLVVLLAAGQVSLRAADETDRFAALIGLARVKRDAGDAGAARRYFEEARRVRPLLPAELAEYFWVVAAIDPSSALMAGRDVLSATPRNADVRDRMIAAAVALHDESSVVALAAAGQQVDPASARWPRRLGDSYLRQGRPADAVKAFDAAVAATMEKDVRDRASLAVALEASGQHGRALATWTAVPATVRAEHAEWITSRLRALAYAGRAMSAAQEITAWLDTHPEDEGVRVALVDLWTRDGQPARALEALTPLLKGPTPERWLAREAELARAAGTLDVAVAHLTALAARPNATAADQWTLANVLVDAQEYARAESVATAASPVAVGCDDRLLTVLDRIPGPTGTDALLKTLQARSCMDRPQWLTRGIDRAVADGRHVEALTLLRRLPAADASTLAMHRLEGQLLLWTGHAVDAAAVLDAVVSEHPDDLAARQALVDAYRTAGASVAAWTAAQPLLRGSVLPGDRRLGLATLALDARRPDDAMAILEGTPTAAVTDALRLEITARARLMQGRPADALRALSTVNTGDLTPDGALALVDSMSATQGMAAAVGTARQFGATTPPWREVLARRVVLEAIVGDRDASTRLRASLASVDATTAVITDVEIALAQERPHDALALLDGLGATTSSASRITDLRATALEGVGDYASAATLISKLVIEEPFVASFAVRYAMAEWRLHPSTDTLGAVLGLPARWPGNEDAAIAASTVLASESRFSEALGILGDPASWNRLPTGGRMLAARSLLGLGRSKEALDVIENLPDLTAGSAILRAQLIAAVRGAGAASAAFRAAAAGPGATPDVYLSWSAVAQSETDRLDVLNAGSRRFPANVPLLTALASAEWTQRHRAAATAAAERAVGADPHAGVAWFVLVDAAADTSSASALDSVLSRFDAMTSEDTSLRIGMAEHVIGVGRSADSGLVARALGWLDAIPVDHPLAAARDLARVRVLAASKQWPEALRDIDRVVAIDDRAPAPLKLKAEVLSWSGRHQDAIAAYDAYLAVAPQDVEARRQQARVATWAGRADQARALYASLQAAAPDNAAIAAEARAKTAFMAGRWDAAAAGYRAWLAIEPSDTEARFELAESLRASDHVADADAELEQLVATSGHQLAFAARRRESTLRAPSFSVIDDEKNANGYNGQRLLDYRQRGGGFTATLGSRGATRIGAEGTRLDAGSGETDRSGYRVGVSVDQRVSSSIRLDGQVAAWTLTPTDRGLALWSGGAAWRATDMWTLLGGVQREAIIESLSTIDARLTASGAFAAASHEASSSSFDLRGSWQSLSDGNGRRRASLTYTRVVDERVRQLRAVVWAEELAYRDRTPLYFSPSGFLRADAGLEYTHAFGTPRFRGDRRNELAAGYLLGTDSRGTLYQHPSIRLNLELANGVAFDARGSLIRSATYNESAFTIGLRLVGVGSDKR